MIFHSTVKGILHKANAAFLGFFKPKDEVKRFIRNVVQCLPDYKSSDPTREHSAQSLP